MTAPDRPAPDGKRAILPADVPPFREYLRQYLEREGVSLKQLTRTLGINHSTVVLWSQGRNPEARYVIAFARLAGIDERVALAAAGHWPPDLPITDPASLDVAPPDDVVAAVRDARAVRPDIPEHELADLLRYWVLLSDDQRDLLFELIRRAGARIRRNGDGGERA